MKEEFNKEMDKDTIEENIELKDEQLDKVTGGGAYKVILTTTMKPSPEGSMRGINEIPKK